MTNYWISFLLLLFLRVTNLICISASSTPHRKPGQVLLSICWAKQQAPTRETSDTQIDTQTLHATLCGHNFPNPRGGWMRRSRVTTSRCFILPLQAKHDMRSRGTFSAPHLPQESQLTFQNSPHKPDGLFSNLLCLRVIFWPYSFEFI
jgi:hypothetical protein